MTAQGADKAITTSALLVAGIYTYRRLTEGAASSKGSRTAQLLGQGSPPSVGVFITAWGTAFLIMAIMAQVSPGLGGSFAIATAVADVLSNGQQLAKDINGKVGAGAKSTGAGAPTRVTPAQKATSQLLAPTNGLQWNPNGALPTIP
jgi:hypothetical protein